MTDPVSRRFNGELGVISVGVERRFSDTIKPKAVIMSAWMTRRLLVLATHVSYRSAAEDFNEDTFRSPGAEADGAIAYTTLQHIAETWGNRAHSGFAHEADLVLDEASGGAPEVSMDKLVGTVRQDIRVGAVPPEVSAMIEEFNAGRGEEFRIKGEEGISDAVTAWAERDETVSISFDGVLQHKQREERAPKGKSSGRGPKKWLEVTDTSISAGGRNVMFPAKDQEEASRLALAVILANGLESKKFAFFSDGAKSIRNSVYDVWGTHVRGYYLDPLHLSKKIDEKISLGVKGKKEEKAALRRNLFGIIWAGNVEGFIRCVRDIPEDKIKNKAAIENLVSYVDDKRNMIPCYALRNLLGLKNSSNDAELANRILVTQRGKNAAMSWSKKGSLALAAITACHRSGQLERLIAMGKPSLLAFKTVA
ncbi:MAG: hypothetical protein J6N50_01850 [Bacteroidales bacterium]|nr:hypothetical protein [Bacteroidales bacterium]